MQEIIAELRSAWMPVIRVGGLVVASLFAWGMSAQAAGMIPLLMAGVFPGIFSVTLLAVTPALLYAAGMPRWLAVGVPATNIAIAVVLAAAAGGLSVVYSGQPAVAIFHRLWGHTAPWWYFGSIFLIGVCMVRRLVGVSKRG